MGRYLEIPILQNRNGEKYRANAIYPQIDPSENDLYVITTEGDRYDKLAYQYYGSVEYWWIIAAVNPTTNADSLCIPPGTQVRIPGNISEYLQKYESVNKI